MAPRYAELHCLSNFSFQRGASHAEELVERAQRLGYAAIAITDECSLAGIVRAHVAAKEYGIKLIVGAELSFADGLRVALLAPDREAYGDLSQLISQGRRQAEKGHYRLERDQLAALSSRLLALWLPDSPPSLPDGHWLAKYFAGRAWVAVELHYGSRDKARLRELQAAAEACGLRCTAAGDVHMHDASRQALQDVLTAIR
ncbi:PHP domain-containing protein, partial [Chitinimonas sp.]|uniref:PHP domain-containing protein n=1 Tax=Chitinimonas sp. TaxID=1934313 RepID=UPI0035ADA1B7